MFLIINWTLKLNYASFGPPPVHRRGGAPPRSCRADAEEVEEGQRDLVVGARRRRRRGEGGARARCERRGARGHVVACGGTDARTPRQAVSSGGKKHDM